jgi:ribosomal protein S18 acetylase RimI-like enzyme
VSADLNIRRLLVPADVAAFRAIRLEGLRREPEAFGSDLAAEETEPEAWFAERLETSEVVGAFRGDKLCGVACLGFHSATRYRHKGSLWGMYVRPESRGAGVARALATEVIRRARDRVEILQLCVYRANRPARRLYTALGFQEYGLEKDALKVGDRYFDDILMALDLRPH